MNDFKKKGGADHLKTNSRKTNITNLNYLKMEDLKKSKKTGNAAHLKTKDCTNNKFNNKNMKLEKKSNKRNEPIKSYAAFWNWFQNNEKSFFDVVKNYPNRNIEKDFFIKLSSKLTEFKEGFNFLVGMSNDKTVELNFTADGIIKNIVFMEELVEQAPKITGWKFVAHKPAVNINKIKIHMADYTFNKDNLFFYSNEDANYPDKINISVVHSDLTEKNRDVITYGIYIFLDSYLGELNAVTIIDNIKIIGKHEAKQKLMPIKNLKKVLIEKHKKFIAKYEGIRYHKNNDEHSTLVLESKSKDKLFAIINTQLLNWDNKASHPWVATFVIKYKSTSNEICNNKIYELLQEIEDEMICSLPDKDGYLNIGKQIAYEEKIIYFACKDFS